jgi:hypothetical protein
MMENLRDNGIDPGQIPMVIQFNKRDMPNVRTDAEIEEVKRTSKEPVFTAVAIRGEGVLETLYALLKLAYRSLNARYEFEGKFGISEAEFLRGVFKRTGGGDRPLPDSIKTGTGEHDRVSMAREAQLIRLDDDSGASPKKKEGL